MTTRTLTMTGDSWARKPLAAVPTGLKPPGATEYGDSGFVLAPDLADRAESLIADYDELSHLNGLTITYLWKAKGGATNGKATLGKCSKPSGLLAHFSGADFVVWLAGDHVTAHELDDRQIEALLYHELKHADLDEDKGEPVLRAHDATVFFDELRRYGTWMTDLETLSETVRQLRMDLAS